MLGYECITRTPLRHLHLHCERLPRSIISGLGIFNVPQDVSETVNTGFVYNPETSRCLASEPRRAIKELVPSFVSTSQLSSSAVEMAATPVAAPSTARVNASRACIPCRERYVQFTGRSLYLPLLRQLRCMAVTHSGGACVRCGFDKLDVSETFSAWD